MKFRVLPKKEHCFLAAFILLQLGQNQKIIPVPSKRVTISITDDDKGSPNDDGKSIVGAVLVIRCQFNDNLNRNHEPHIYMTGFNKHGSYTEQRHISTDRIIASSRWDDPTKYVLALNYTLVARFIELKIKYAENIDSGKYKCLLVDSNDHGNLLSEDEMGLTIFVNTDSVILIGAEGNGNLLIHENEDKTLICAAVGGHRPDMSLRIGNETSLRFELQETERDLGLGGTLSIYTGEVTFKHIVMTNVDKLTCVSQVQGYSEVTDQVNINIIPAALPNDAQTTRQESVTASNYTTTPLCHTSDQSSSSTKVTPLIITEIWLVNVIKAVFKQKLQ